MVGRWLVILALIWVSSLASSEPPLKLDLSTDAKNPLYPKESFKVIYRISYRGNIKLTKEELPFLDPKGFRKIGDIFITNEASDDYQVQVITITLEALEPGKYAIGKSILEGTLEYLDEKLHAEVEGLTFEVLPFPEKNQPLTFTGGMGEFELDVELLTPLTMEVGDLIKLRLTLTGGGDLSKIQLPKIKCLPGFSGYFSLSDIPPTSKVVDGKKIFEIELRPMTPAIKEIPSFEFSYFDPELKSYRTKSSAPIPITVNLNPSSEIKKEIKMHQDEVNWDQILAQSPLQGQSLYQVELKLNENLTKLLQDKENKQNFGEISKTLLALGKYSWAILYEMRFLKENPDDVDSLKRLNESRAKLFLPESKLWNYFLFQKKYMNPDIYLRLMAFFLTFGILMMIFYFLSRRNLLLILGGIAFFLGAISISLLIYVHYLSAPLGVVVISTPLYRGPKESYGFVSDVPIPSGSVVSLLSDQDGWLKVQLENGEIGFIDSERVKGV